MLNDFRITPLPTPTFGQTWWGPPDPAHWTFGVNGFPMFREFAGVTSVLRTIAGIETPADDEPNRHRSSDDTPGVRLGLPGYQTGKSTTIVAIPDGWDAAHIRDGLFPALTVDSDWQRAHLAMPTAVLRYGPEFPTPRVPGPEDLTWLPAPDGLPPVEPDRWSLILDLLDVDDLEQVPTSISELRIAMRLSGQPRVCLHIVAYRSLLARGVKLLPLAVGYPKPDPPIVLGGFSDDGALAYGEQLAGPTGRSVVQAAIAAGYTPLVATPRGISRLISASDPESLTVTTPLADLLDLEVGSLEAQTAETCAPMDWPFIAARRLLEESPSSEAAWSAAACGSRGGKSRSRSGLPD